jgi:hypothetical protein
MQRMNRAPYLYVTTVHLGPNRYGTVKKKHELDTVHTTHIDGLLCLIINRLNLFVSAFFYIFPVNLSNARIFSLDLHFFANLSHDLFLKVCSYIWGIENTVWYRILLVLQRFPPAIRTQR